jgi:hypothetical protein
MLIAVSDFTFGEQLVLNLAGPLLTALLGTFAISLFANRITRKAQARREDQRQRAQDMREDHALRGRLITAVTEAPTALYLATQHYWRVREDVSGEALQAARRALDDQYLDSRRKGMALQYELGLHFPDPAPSKLMHRVMDLLMIRYFQLIREGGASDNLRRLNAGEEHTGLTVDELKAPKKVLDKYHETLQALVDTVGQARLEVGPSAQRQVNASATPAHPQGSQ